MTDHYISCFDVKTHTLDVFEVDHSVYVYIRQLESALKHDPKGFFNLYHFRFGKEKENYES
jgi:hypothetical protein